MSRFVPTAYAPLLADLKARVRAAQVKAAVAVNRELMLLYWHIGRAILRAQWAEGGVKRATGPTAVRTTRTLDGERSLCARPGGRLPPRTGESLIPPGSTASFQMKFTAILFSLVALLCGQSLVAEPSRPKLQIINGSTQAVDVFWIKSDTERVSNGTVAPGENTIITATLGNRFAVVGRNDKTERIVTSEVPVQAMRFDPPDPDGIPAFYTQRMKAGGFPIVASAKVNPYALKEAAYLVDLMLAKRPDVRAAMVKSGARLCILAWNEFTTDQPEWLWLARLPVPEFPGIAPRDFRDARARGMGGSATDPFCSCAEENLLAYPGDPYSTENILIHELAHNIHLRGLANVDAGFDARVKAAYDAAMKAGLWKGKYASVNHHEYFAEGVQSWFDDNRENDHDHNHVNTRAELLEYDAGLAALCREVFGDTVLKYTKPTTRLTGHLEGYDPAKAPRFVWPERLRRARDEIRRQAQERSRKGGASLPPSRPAGTDAVQFSPTQLFAIEPSDRTLSLAITD